jgi:hypothetical protein
MVNAGERGSDEAKPPEKGDCVKSAPITALPLWPLKADSLRTQQAIARFGKTARHPLCLAALDLCRLDEELSKCTKDVVATEELVNSAKQMEEKAQAEIAQFRKERKEKEANEAYALLRKIDKHLLDAQKCYEAAVKLRSMWRKLRRWPAAVFEREYHAALCSGDSKACRALQRLRKRWIANEASLKDGNARKLETLNMLRDKVTKAAWAKDGGIAGHLEAARGAFRALSDEDWQGRLTAREIHSHIAATRGSRVAGDKDAKEIRRLARKLPLRLAEDQRGRKWKPYLPKQGPKQPRGRPHTKPKLRFMGDLEALQAIKVAAGKIPVRRR